jgi:hypothetical protein
VGKRAETLRAQTLAQRLFDRIGRALPARLAHFGETLASFVATATAGSYRYVPSGTMMG